MTIEELATLTKLLSSETAKEPREALEALERADAPQITVTRPIPMTEVLETYSRRTKLSHRPVAAKGNFQEVLNALRASTAPTVLIYSFDQGESVFFVFATPSGDGVISVLKVRPGGSM